MADDKTPTMDPNPFPTSEEPAQGLLHDPEVESTISSLEEADAPPPFGEQYGQVSIKNDSLDTRANVTEDGRINLTFAEKHRRLSELVPMIAKKQGMDIPVETLAVMDTENYDDPPPMKIVIQIIGSRGDIQPFIALGKVLKEKYGHQVRVATHPTFKQFVTENGLDFFDIGGDPAELMS
jgi:Glycosyltransferase family 28 N-terminal domain